MTNLILHHYDFSSFAEKIRLILGFKNVAWQSVDQPSILPKPNLVPLTGGYRRIPVLQEGADLWCDTRLIARELERRFPSPTLFPEATRGAAEIVSWWAEQQFMRPVALYVSGVNADHMPPGLHEDRAGVHGRPAPSIEAVRAAATRNLHTVRPQIAWLAAMLQDGRPFLLGDTPCIADFSAYLVIWFFKALPIDCSGAFGGYPKLRAWRERMAAIGHGRPTDIDPVEALDLARSAEPARARPSQPQDGDPLPGQRARVRSTDNAKDWVEGTVSFIDADEIALLREDTAVGRVAVHFPRLGYEWRRG